MSLVSFFHSYWYPRNPEAKGRRYGPSVTQWFSTFLETEKIELVYFDDQFEPRYTKILEPEFPSEANDDDIVGYQDTSPYHLASMESLQDLNQRLQRPIEIYGFRPNIIVTGVDKPYGEVREHQLKLG